MATAPLVTAPVAIPFGDPGHSARPSDLYYESVVTQMQRAWLERDRASLARLVDTHDRSDAPAWAQERVASFRRVLLVMQFEEAVLDRGELDLPSPLPALGERLSFAVRLGPLPSMPVRLPGGDDPLRARFVLLFRMTDTDSFGTQMDNARTQVVDLPATVDLAAGGAVEVPLAVDVPAAGSIVRRVAIEVFLMPGHVELEGARLPNRWVRCACGEVELLPRGHEPIAAQPLVSLRAALQLGDAAHFPHVFLAARQLARHGASEDCQSAASLLIDRVRLGGDEQARSASAALSELVADASSRPRDREGWLQWWAERPLVKR